MAYNTGMESISGSVERVTYYNPENGYSVLRLLPEETLEQGQDRQGLVTVVGNLPEIAPGEHLSLNGEWVSHKKHGLQFQVQTIEQTLPVTLEGVQRYLASGLLEGIGPKLAERIIEHFGEATLDVIENEPKRLREVADIGAKRSAQIVKAWQEQKQVKEIMIFLHSHNISTNLALKIYRQYEDQSLAVVQQDPYQLASDIFGVGFKTADRIAQSMGLPFDHPSRIETGTIYSLEEMVSQGHVFAPRPLLEEKAADLLKVERSLVSQALERLAEEERLVLDSLPLVEGQPPEKHNAVYLTPYYFAETGVAAHLREMAGTLPSRLSDIPPSLTALDTSLTEQQAGAIRTALSQPVTVLTGGPGTGKTTAIKALIAAVEAAGKRYALASPTGRAAKRLAEACGREASTIHRLLEYSPRQGFTYNAQTQLKLDLLVVDEASMLDVLLANSLLRALEPGTHLLLVGDVDQLPSVGAGDVLRDIIRSGIATVTRLDVIFRQAANSDIIQNAHRINQGEMPLFEQDSRDFFRFPADTPQEAGDWVEELVVTRIPAKFGIPSEEIQVLSPMYRGEAGINALNARLQQALNPGSPLKAERRMFGQLMRAGDKVMQIRNDYEKQVFNGDIGLIKEISATEHTLDVVYDGRAVTYAWSECDQLTLAYAVSVHKAQGSEFPAIVMPLLTQHYMMLQRNLLYTGVTRAEKLCVLVSNYKALAIAIKNNQVAERHTWLDKRIIGEVI